MNPGPRFDASILFGHQQVLSNVMWRMQMGQVFALTPDEYRQLNDLAGCLNYYSTLAPAGLTLAVQPVYASDPHVQANVDLYMEPGYCYAIPVRLPAYPCRYEWSLCEFGGEPLGHRAKLSAVAGDLAGTEDQQNRTPTLVFDVGTVWPVSGIGYANVALSVGIDRGHKTHYSCIQR